ncbi:MAG: AAA family ATPase, partial [Methermicoccaceae archaeon]
KKMKVIEDYVAGYPFKQIASRAKVSEGSVSNIINELYTGELELGFEDEVEMLREIAVELRKEGMGVAQARAGFALLRRLHEIGAEPEQLKEFTAVCKRQDERFVRAATRLASLEERYGDYEDVLNELELKGEQVHTLEHELQEQNSQKEALEAELTALRREHELAESIVHMRAQLESAAEERDKLQRETEAIKDVMTSFEKLRQTASAHALPLTSDTIDHMVEMLALHGKQGVDALHALSARLKTELLSPEEALSLIQRIKGIEALGFGIDEAERLATELNRMEGGIDQSLKQLISLIKEHGSMVSAVEKMRQKTREAQGRIRSLNGQISSKKRQLARLEHDVQAKKELVASLNQEASELDGEIATKRENTLKVGVELAHLLHVKPDIESILNKKKEVEAELAEQKEQLETLTSELSHMLGTKEEASAILQRLECSKDELEKLQATLKEAEKQADELEALRQWRTYLLSGVIEEWVWWDIKALMRIHEGETEPASYVKQKSEDVRKAMVKLYREMIDGDIASVFDYENLQQKNKRMGKELDDLREELRDTKQKLHDCNAKAERLMRFMDSPERLTQEQRAILKEEIREWIKVNRAGGFLGSAAGNFVEDIISPIFGGPAFGTWYNQLNGSTCTMCRNGTIHCYQALVGRCQRCGTVYYLGSEQDALKNVLTR